MKMKKVTVKSGDILTKAAIPQLLGKVVVIVCGGHTVRVLYPNADVDMLDTDGWVHCPATETHETQKIQFDMFLDWFLEVEIVEVLDPVTGEVLSGDTDKQSADFDALVKDLNDLLDTTREEFAATYDALSYAAGERLHAKEEFVLDAGVINARLDLLTRVTQLPGTPEPSTSAVLHKTEAKSFSLVALFKRLFPRGKL